MDLAYDGTDFSGWARQPGRRTVQGTLEAALATVLRLESPPALTVAGRTDAGVHASAQVAHVDLDVSGDQLADRLNALLPPDLRLLRLRRVPASFDARFSALSRRYVYRVTDGILDPLRRRDTVAHRRPLDPGPMRAAAAPLLGEHDFAAFCRQRSGATTVRTLLRLDIGKKAGRVLELSVEADAFCHSMVRALVGALLAVGDGRRPQSWPAAVLRAGTRDPAATVAPAHGLTLTGVRYPPARDYAARAERTRTIRRFDPLAERPVSSSPPPLA